MFGFSKSKTIIDERQIDELLTRGIENIFPNREFLKSKLMKGERVTLYLGIDPTGPTLHLGHVIPLKKLGVFQRLGHQIILLIGDTTAIIGDPTDKTAVRKKLTSEEIMSNCKEYKEQASKFISFSGPNKAFLKFNSEWLLKQNFNDILEFASAVTVDQMLKRDMFVRRTQEEKPIYLHEFLYPLMQGIDSVSMDVDGEIGGNDQTFNMLIGRDLLKKYKNKEKFVMATKLLIDSTGKKMGKTENNMVALNQSPEEMFGRVMSWDDELIAPGFEIITDISMPEIEEIKNSLNSGENPRDFKVRLAREVVKMYYGEDKAVNAKKDFENTFSKGGVPEDVVEVSFAKGTLLIDALVSQQLIGSRTIFRRYISQGSITDMSTGEKIADSNIIISETTYKIGPRQFIKIKVL